MSAKTLTCIRGSTDQGDSNLRASVPVDKIREKSGIDHGNLRCFLHSLKGRRTRIILLHSYVQESTFTSSNVEANVQEVKEMANGKFISYLRVSTARQGVSGLGIEAQRESVSNFLNGGRWTLVQEVVEIESGKRNDRPAIAEALRLCRLHRATLVIAKLDRLARNVHFISSLMESGVEFIAVDFPQANRLTVHILAAVAEHEAKMISDRTKAALSAAKVRGVELGGRRGQLERMPAMAAKGNKASAAVRSAAAAKRNDDLMPVIREVLESGPASNRQIADVLNERGITAARGGAWSAVQVRRILERVPVA
jgi:DNA invertase Pin-like site-specific DNA recombinase